MISIIIMIIAFVAFIAIVVWAYWPSAEQKFIDQGKSIFLEDENL